MSTGPSKGGGTAGSGPADRPALRPAQTLVMSDAGGGVPGVLRQQVLAVRHRNGRDLGQADLLARAATGWLLVPVAILFLYRLVAPSATTRRPEAVVALAQAACRR